LFCFVCWWHDSNKKTLTTDIWHNK
jgi:hypothetical protein